MWEKKLIQEKRLTGGRLSWEKRTTSIYCVFLRQGSAQVNLCAILLLSFPIKSYSWWSPFVNIAASLLWFFRFHLPLHIVYNMAHFTRMTARLHLTAKKKKECQRCFFCCAYFIRCCRSFICRSFTGTVGSDTAYLTLNINSALFGMFYLYSDRGESPW